MRMDSKNRFQDNAVVNEIPNKIISGDYTTDNKLIIVRVKMTAKIYNQKNPTRE